jgi:hypothetical protein
MPHPYVSPLVFLVASSFFGACTDEPQPNLCAEQQHVADHSCSPCPAGSTRAAGDPADGPDTVCEPTLCEADTRVVNHLCVACPNGSTNAAGDDASEVGTPCDATLCGAHERVLEHHCTPCPAGSTHPAGDDATGSNTTCTPCPAGTYDEGDHQCVTCAPGWISEPGQTECEGCAAGTYAVDNSCRACREDFTSDEGATQCRVAAVAARLSARDYGYLFWPRNHWYRWGQFVDVQHIQTGYYGLTFDVSQASFNTLGPIAEFYGPEEALVQDNAVLNALPAAAVTYGVRAGQTIHAATGFYGRERAQANPSELIDMGRFMQRVEIPEVTYAGTSDLAGSIQLAAMTRHFVLTHRTTTLGGGRPLTLNTEISGDALASYPELDWLESARALRLRNDEGQGWTFIIPELAGATATIVRRDDGGLSFRRSYAQTSAGQQLTLPVIGVPFTAGDDAQTRLWISPTETATVQFAQLQRDGSPASELIDATWDPERGLYVIGLGNLVDVGAPRGRPWHLADIHNWYNRHKIVIRNATQNSLSIPLAFDGGGNATFYIVAGSPLLRDMQGEPIGVPVQISKNWHDPPAWYHLYSALELQPGTHELELTFAHSKWGQAYAVAHAQLSLIGWGQNQQWDQSSLGAFGESITYDPDMTLGRSMVDDVRPFLVNAGTEWNWTGNVGGADFLRYVDSEGALQRLGRLRTHYAYTGPNLTKVIYAGVSGDGKIEAKISTQLGRTDDLVRAYYHLNYTFLEDVAYDRLCLFQVAADNYSDNGFTRFAYGDGVQIIDAAITEHRARGYADANARGIPLSGDAPWVMLYDNQRSGDHLPERLANVGFVVRAYQAQIGDAVITTPHINLIRTFNGGWSQMAFELGVPYQANNAVIPAGSRITATVEYLVPPSDKSTYYGASDYLTQMPPDQFQSTAMIQRLARDNRLLVQASIGEVRQAQPVVLDAVDGATAVQFTLTGGLGYVPVTISGLARPDGWRLEQRIDEVWARVDQSVEGNDYWQAYDRAASENFDLIFNLPNRGTHEYRLVR